MAAATAAAAAVAGGGGSSALSLLHPASSHSDSAGSPLPARVRMDRGRTRDDGHGQPRPVSAAAAKLVLSGGGSTRHHSSTRGGGGLGGADGGGSAAAAAVSLPMKAPVGSLPVSPAKGGSGGGGGGSAGERGGAVQPVVTVAAVGARARAPVMGATLPSFASQQEQQWQRRRGTEVPAIISGEGQHEWI